MTTPSPGRGWRWLRVGEIKREGDKYKFRDEWYKTKSPGLKVTTKHFYRRRVKKGKR